MALSTNVKNWIRKTFINNDAAAALVAAIDAATSTNGTQATGILAAQAAADLAANVAFKDQVELLAIEDLAAGADIAARVAYANPLAGQLVSVGLLLVGASAGVDNSNTCVVAITTAAAASIVSKTYNAGTPLTSNVINDLGALDGTNKILAAGAPIKLAVTNGATADTPPMFLVIRFRPDAI